MRHKIQLFLVLITLSLAGNVGYAQNDSIPEEPDAIKRSFDSEKLEELAKDDAFDYNRKDIQRSYSIWELIGMWIAEQIGNFFNMMGQNGEVTKNVLYVISGLVMIYLFSKLLDVDSRGIFFKGSEAKKDKKGFFTENIHEIDFNKALDDAIKAEEYKTAVRILYLALLKSLDSREFIKWKSHKTNHDYEAEIEGIGIKQDFESLTRYFEYICYGDFSLDRQNFEKAKEIYEHLNQQIQKKVLA
ncbi:DUF4129 domain-containing protein [Chondrinema litorale]|uniref:DUF4129 domain-containing protein n=1 Tax=Chondrinema litorale TaxID=2994555 RepID=UPI002543DC61|nr:DUF4129 domain-containing protein [Chondrinema litorale]UZR94271.1 DUF4129 domain-containing protein [Chondrinema litorale]